MINDFGNTEMNYGHYGYTFSHSAQNFITIIHADFEIQELYNDTPMVSITLFKPINTELALL